MSEPLIVSPKRYETKNFSFPPDFKTSLLMLTKEEISQESYLFKCMYKNCQFLGTDEEIKSYIIAKRIVCCDVKCPLCQKIWFREKEKLPSEIENLLSLKDRVKIWAFSDQNKNLIFLLFAASGSLLFFIAIYFQSILSKNDPLYFKIFPSFFFMGVGSILYAFFHLIEKFLWLTIFGKILGVLGAMGTIYSIATELFYL